MAADIIRPEIRALSSYHVQNAAGMIKLDAMENPFAFPEALRGGLAQALATASLNRYPPAGAEALKSEIRAAMHIPDGLDILLGNGSDEIIQLIAMAVAKPGAGLLSVEPAFVMFKMIATFCGLNYIGVPLRADFSLDQGAILAAIDREQPALTFIAYPNNPTGNLFDRVAVHEIIAATGQYGGLVVIDEAYFAFSPESFLDEIATHPNAVLMRTVSKLGLAGIRLGMLIGRGMARRIRQTAITLQYQCAHPGCCDICHAALRCVSSASRDTQGRAHTRGHGNRSHRIYPALSVRLQFHSDSSAQCDANL